MTGLLNTTESLYNFWEENKEKQLQNFKKIYQIQKS